MNTFKVLTYNIFKFGGPVSAEKVIARVLALGPDVMGFQEVFNTRFAIGFKSRNAKRLLKRQLEPQGYATAWQPTSGPGPFRLLTFNKFRDGILIAADTRKWDLDPRRDHFSVPLNDKTFARRAIQCLLLQEKDGARKVAVFNAHLSVGTKDKIRARRRSELERALAFIRRIASEHAPVASVLMGDFNAVKQEIGPVFLEGGPGTRFQDTWEEMNLRAPEESGNTIDLNNTLIQARPAKKRRESMRIDYILLHPHPGEAGADAVVEPSSSAVRLAETEEVVRGGVGVQENLSDHYGVLTEFQLT